MCEALTYLLDNIYIRFGTKLYRHIVGFPNGTNCAPLVADLFLFCYERDFMMSLSDVKPAEITEAFKSTTRQRVHYMLTISAYVIDQKVCELLKDISNSV